MRMGRRGRLPSGVGTGCGFDGLPDQVSVCNLAGVAHQS